MEEQRLFKRFDKEITFVVKVSGEQVIASRYKLQARTINISAGGCAFYHCSKLSLQSQVEIVLQIKNKLFIVKGIVVRKDEKANGQFIYAIKFIFENEIQQQQLDQALRDGLDEYSLTLTREYPRIEINLPSISQSLNTKRPIHHSILIKNFSPLGAKLLSKEPIEESILLHLPNFPNHIKAKKVWEKREGSNYSVGIEFIELTPKLVNKLKEYVLNDIRRLHLEQQLEQQGKLVSLKE